MKGLLNIVKLHCQYPSLFYKYEFPIVPVTLGGTSEGDHSGVLVGERFSRLALLTSTVRLQLHSTTEGAGFYRIHINSSALWQSGTCYFISI